MPTGSDLARPDRRGVKLLHLTLATALALVIFACVRALPGVTTPADATALSAVPAEASAVPVVEADGAQEGGVAPEAQIGAEPIDVGDPSVDAAEASAAEPALEPATTEARAETRGPIPVPNLLRVGLATDLEEVVLPCCQTEVLAEADGRLVALTSTVRIQPVVPPGAVGGYRLQVAALKDEGQARGLAGSLAERGAATPIDVVFDAAVDLYRVRVGRFGDRAAAEAAQRTLAGLGMGGSWIVSERAGLREAALRVELGEGEKRIEGRWLRVRSRHGDGILTHLGRYRGNILVYLNDRGALNLINELPLEEYLRGVVPRELGPEVYPSLEALKAQAVAARTYTVRNLGEFAGEGYDICATPRCQVYAGMDAEHVLSDRAVSETADEVLVHGGRPIDALYSSTCGGHTEDVAIIFPLKSEPYLKGVPCLESGVDRIVGAGLQGIPFPDALTRAAVPRVGDRNDPDALAARLVRLAQLAGLSIPQDRLHNLERRELQRYIATLFDLTLDARLFVAPTDVDYLLRNRPEGWSDEDVRLGVYLVKSGLLSGDPEAPLSDRQIEETLLQLGLSLRVFEHREVRYLSRTEGAIVVRERGERTTYTPTDATVTFRREGDHATTAPLALLAGDRLDLYLQGDEVAAMVHRVESSGATYDRSSRMSSWTRFHTDDELADSVHQRYPGFGFEDFEIAGRGISGRVGKIRMRGTDGATQEVEGLAVRWTLDVPDTLFTVKRLEPPGRDPGWLFQGRGWGHGVGMCQVGAYGMGLRGHDYREILSHYYRDVSVERVQLVDRWTDRPVASR